MTNSLTVDDAVYFIRGITFKPNELISPEAADAVICMRTKNIQEDLDESDLIAVPRDLVPSKEKYLRAGDVLISSANSWNLVGKCSYVGELGYPATAGGFIAIIRPKPRTTHPRFLYHWLDSPRVQDTIRNLGRQTTNISNLDVKRFKELEFPSLNYEKQQSVATILDEADGIRRKRAHALVLADKFLRSAYVHTVGHLNPKYDGWEPFSIERLAASHKGAIRSGPFGSALRHGEFVDEGIAVLGIDNAVQNKFAWDERRFITEEKYDELRRYKVFPRDVIITIMGTTGRSAVVPEDIPEAITTKHLATITCNTDLILPEVLSFAIHSDPMIVRQIEAHNKGAIMDGLNLGIIRNLILKRPPMEEQRRFTAILTKTRMLQEQLSSPQMDGSDLFFALSQRAFRGEL